MLISGNDKGIALPNVATTDVRTFVNKRSSFANVLSGTFSDAYSKQLLGWRCRSCGLGTIIQHLYEKKCKWASQGLLGRRGSEKGCNVW